MKILWALLFLSVSLVFLSATAASSCTFSMHGKTVPRDEDDSNPTGPALQGHYRKICDLISYDLRTNLGAQEDGADEIYVSTYLKQSLGRLRLQTTARYNFGSSFLEKRDDTTRVFIHASAPLSIGVAEITPGVSVTRILGIEESFRNGTLAEAHLDLSMEVAQNITFLAHVRSSTEVSKTPVSLQASSTLSMRFSKNLSGEFSARGNREDGAQGALVLRYTLQE